MLFIKEQSWSFGSNKLFDLEEDIVSIVFTEKGLSSRTNSERRGLSQSK